jgi:hypothetical protein
MLTSRPSSRPRTLEELLHPPSVDESVLATEEHLDPPSAVQRLRLPSGAAAPPPQPIHANAAERRSPEPKPKPMQPDATDTCTHELVRAMIDLAAEGDTTPAPVPGHQASRDFGSTEAPTLTNKRDNQTHQTYIGAERAAKTACPGPWFDFRILAFVSKIPQPQKRGPINRTRAIRPAVRPGLPHGRPATDRSGAGNSPYSFRISFEDGGQR